jgi:hypothetical protein
LCQILIEFPPAAAADIPTTAATSNTNTHTFKAQQQLQDSHDLSESLSLAPARPLSSYDQLTDPCSSSSSNIQAVLFLEAKLNQIMERIFFPNLCKNPESSSMANSCSKQSSLALSRGYSKQAGMKLITNR